MNNPKRLPNYDYLFKIALIDVPEKWRRQIFADLDTDYNQMGQDFLITSFTIDNKIVKLQIWFMNGSTIRTLHGARLVAIWPDPYRAPEMAAGIADSIRSTDAVKMVICPSPDECPDHSDYPDFYIETSFETEKSLQAMAQLAYNNFLQMEAEELAASSSVASSSAASAASSTTAVGQQALIFVHSQRTNKLQPITMPLTIKTVGQLIEHIATYAQRPGSALTLTVYHGEMVNGRLTPVKREYTLSTGRVVDLPQGAEKAIPAFSVNYT